MPTFFSPSSRLPSGSPLRVFVSSSIREFRNARAIVKTALKSMFIEAFVFESDAGCHREPVIETCLKEAGESDLFVGLFGTLYGRITVEEFRHARKLRLPCLVYIRNGDLHRERELEEFLANSVCDPASGVTYDYFETDVALGEKVARDVMRVLVEGYRLGSREVPFDVLPPVARLAWDVADWYQALGYKLVAGPVFLDQRTMDLRMQVHLNLPGIGLVSQELQVRTVAGRVKASDAKDFADTLDSCGAAKGQLVSDLEVTPAARREVESCENLSLLTFDELLDQTVRLEEYFDRLGAEIESRGIPTDYIPLACVEEESPSAGGESLQMNRYPAEEGGIDKYVAVWLRNWQNEHLSILGEFGTGKTWFVLHLAGECLQQYRKAKAMGVPRPRIPLVLSLRDFAKAIRIESLFSEFFFAQHNVGLPSYEAFRQLNRMGKLLLLFDGFDEMAARVDRQEMINNFWEFARVLVPGGKAILTCRTEHFPDAKEGRALLNAELQASTAMLTGESPQFEVVELEKFDPGQIRELLSRKTSPENVEKVMGNPDLLDLARRPLMTELIVEALPDVDKGSAVDLSRIYLYAVRRKMERDIKAERTFTSLADKLYFLCELSWEMLASDQTSLNFKLFPDRLRRLFGEIVREQKDLDHWHYDMAGQTMLIRNAHGDYSPAHRSLLEFFAAYKFIAEMGVMAADFAEVAQKQSSVDKEAQRKDYTWSSYFRRELDADGRVQAIAPLGSFATENVDEVDEPKDAVNAEKLPRNALAFSAGMVSTDPGCLDKLCEMLWERTGGLARNAFYLLPLLKYECSETLVTILVEKSRAAPLRSGVAWLLGELGVSTASVLDALNTTLHSFAEDGKASPSAWWECAFALEKLGALGPRKGRQGNEALELLIRNLPPGRTLQQAIESLTRCLNASQPREARTDQSDIAVIVRHEGEFDPSELFRDVLDAIDFSTEALGRRCYYDVWLCGHLGIQRSVPRILAACGHPHGSVRNCACEALGKIGKASPQVLRALEVALKDAYYRTRFHAAWSLGELGAIASIPKLSAEIKVEEVRDVREEMIRVRDCLLQKAEPGDNA